MTDEKGIRTLLRAYQEARSPSDAGGMSNLFTRGDAVLIAPNNTPIQGRATIQIAYEEIFRSIKLDITCEIDEPHVVSAMWAFVRSHSKLNFTKRGSQMPFDTATSQDLFLTA